MAINGVDTNLSALSALATQMQVSANNIANVNTNGFKSSRTELETGPNDQGVYVADVRKSTTPGSLVPSLEPVENPDTGRTTTQYQYVEGSNTDIPREFVNMMTAQRAYEANVAAIRSWDETMGTVLDELA